MSRRPAARAATLAAAAALVLTASAGCRASEPIPPAPDTSLGAMADAVCQARRQAATDPAAARDTFFDGAHEDLHDLARRLETVDRGAAAAVLEAKQRVESDLEEGRATLATDLAGLHEATRRGLARLAVDAPPCNT